MKWRELRQPVEDRERVYYVDIIRRYPWPVSAIRAASPVVAPTMGAAALLSKRCRRVTYDWLADDTGWRLAPDEQGALLRYHGEREPLAYIVQHAHGGLTGWYLRPEIPKEVRAWLCPKELGLQLATVWQPEPGDQVIWMVEF
jgi:hypothetical protein